MRTSRSGRHAGPAAGRRDHAGGIGRGSASLSSRPATMPLAFITQTTLSVDDTVEIVDVLRRRFPAIAGPHREDICYATTNRQEAIKRIAGGADLVLVIGAPNSSNSVRLVEVALRAGAKRAVLIQRAGEIDWSAFAGVQTVGLSAGASAPEVLVDRGDRSAARALRPCHRGNDGDARGRGVQRAQSAGVLTHGRLHRRLLRGPRSPARGLRDRRAAESSRASPRASRIPISICRPTTAHSS